MQASASSSHSAAGNATETIDKKDGKQVRPFKAGIDSAEARHKRVAGKVQLRKKQRDDQVAKKRAGRATDGSATAAAGSISSEPPLRELPTYTKTVLQSSEPTEVLKAVTACRQLSAIDHGPPLTDIISSGILPRLMMFAKDNARPELQFETVWLLTNLLSGNSENVAVVVQEGFIP
jgi:hypothetical protein